MKVLKALFLLTTLFCLVVAPASAGYYISGGSSYGFGFTGFSFPTPPAPLPPSTSTGGTSTLNTSSCLYNSCAPTTPTNSPAVTTPTITTSAFGGSFYGGSSWFGGYRRYSVFGMYNIQGTSTGGMQTPVLSGGVSPPAFATNPEPTTIVLFGAGLLALGWARRRKMSGKG